MLTNSYDEVRKDATLYSRLSFAQCILKHELVAQSLGMATKVGEPQPDGAFVYEFRSIRCTEEDSGDGFNPSFPGDIEDGGGSDPFQDPKPSGYARIQEALDELQDKVEYSQKLLMSAHAPHHEALLEEAAEKKAFSEREQKLRVNATPSAPAPVKRTLSRGLTAKLAVDAISQGGEKQKDKLPRKKSFLPRRSSAALRPVEQGHGQMTAKEAAHAP
jgi:hypothetical protein